MHFDNIFNNGSINKISNRNRCTRYTRFILGKPLWGRKTQQAFSLRVSSYNVNTCLGMPPTKSSESEGHVPSARTYPTKCQNQIPRYKVSSSLVRNTKRPSALPRREKDTQQSVSVWMNRIMKREWLTPLFIQVQPWGLSTKPTIK